MAAFTPVNKRPRGSPTFLTPQRPPRRQIRRLSDVQRRRLFSGSQESVSIRTTANPVCEWSSDEIRALVEFVLLHGVEDKWPLQQNPVFWNEAAKFICMRTGLTQVRSGRISAKFRHV